jgi:hypothetical protein
MNERLQFVARPTLRGSTLGAHVPSLHVGFSSLCLSLTRHFLKSASPREKTDGSDRSRFRARAQTAASRAIFASLSAFPAEAAHPIAGWLAR